MTADHWAIAAAGGCFLLNVLLKGLRWYRLLELVGQPLPWAQAFGSFFTSAFYGSVTVGRLGEFLRMGPLTARGMPAAQAATLCAYDRVFDLFTVALIGGVLSAHVLGETGLAFSILAASGLAVLVSGVILPKLLLWLTPLPDAAVSGLRTLVLQVVRALLELSSWRTVLEMGFWTIVSWPLYFAMVWQLAAALQISASQVLLVAATCWATLSTLLPITFQGIGTREAIFAWALAREGVVEERAVLLGLLTIAVVLAMSLVSLAFGLLLERQARRAASGVG